MIQMPTRIAMTFQSTCWNAWISVMAPIQTMIATPTSAAAVLSIQFATTAMMVIANTASVSHCISSILYLPGSKLWNSNSFRRSRNGARFDCGGARRWIALVFLVRLPTEHREHHEKTDDIRNGNVPAVANPL